MSGNLLKRFNETRRQKVLIGLVRTAKYWHPAALKFMPKFLISFFVAISSSAAFCASPKACSKLLSYKTAVERHNYKVLRHQTTLAKLIAIIKSGEMRPPSADEPVYFSLAKSGRLFQMYLPPYRGNVIVQLDFSLEAFDFGNDFEVAPEGTKLRIEPGPIEYFSSAGNSMPGKGRRDLGKYLKKYEGKVSNGEIRIFGKVPLKYLISIHVPEPDVDYVLSRLKRNGADMIDGQPIKEFIDPTSDEKR